MEAENVPDSEQIPPVKRTGIVDDNGDVVFKVAISLGDKNETVIESKIMQEELQRAAERAEEFLREVIQQATNDMDYALEDGATLISAGSSDTTISRSGDTVRTAADDVLSREELEQLRGPLS